MSAAPLPLPTRNRLLAALPPADVARLAPHLERVVLDVKQVFYDVDASITHVYFPEDCVASVLAVMADGTAVETATVGREGVVGLALFHGADRTSAQAFCQVPGAALRLSADAFRAEAARSAALTGVLHLYSQALFTFVAQGSACNRLHAMGERCARWLLHTHDRVGAAEGRNQFPLTHQFLAQMLGVRRASVTEAMGALQAAGCITYALGTVTVVDRAGLERAACECYAVIRREFDRLLGTPGGNGTTHGDSVGATPADPYIGTPTAVGGRSVLGDAEPPGAFDPDT